MRGSKYLKKQRINYQNDKEQIMTIYNDHESNTPSLPMVIIEFRHFISNKINTVNFLLGYIIIMIINMCAYQNEELITAQSLELYAYNTSFFSLKQ